MSIKKVVTQFKKVNGFKVLKQYWKLHVFFFVLAQVFLQGTSKKSLEIIRNAADNKVLNRLRIKYRSEAVRIKQEIDQESYNKIESNQSKKYIWICWFQGIENAPDIVKKCVESVKRNTEGREIVFLTNETYPQYIKFPKEIAEKISAGIITGAHLSDLIRLELLTRYGGTWIDATVYISDTNYPDYLFNSELFVFQKLKPALDGNPLVLSNWFITSVPNHPILLMTKELLYSYWRRNNYLSHYFVFHIFFQIAIEYYPDEWRRVIPSSSSTPHILLLKLFEDFDMNIWKGVQNQTSVHKLSYKFDKELTQKMDTYYQKILLDRGNTL